MSSIVYEKHISRENEVKDINLWSNNIAVKKDYFPHVSTHLGSGTATLNSLVKYYNELGTVMSIANMKVFTSLTSGGYRCPSVAKSVELNCSCTSNLSIEVTYKEGCGASIFSSALATTAATNFGCNIFQITNKNITSLNLVKTPGIISAASANFNKLNDLITSNVLCGCIKHRITSAGSTAAVNNAPAAWNIFECNKNTCRSLGSVATTAMRTFNFATALTTNRNTPSKVSFNSTSTTPLEVNRAVLWVGGGANNNACSTSIINKIQIKVDNKLIHDFRPIFVTTATSVTNATGTATATGLFDIVTAKYII